MSSGSGSPERECLKCGAAGGQRLQPRPLLQSVACGNAVGIAGVQPKGA